MLGTTSKLSWKKWVLLTKDDDGKNSEQEKDGCILKTIRTFFILLLVSICIAYYFHARFFGDLPEIDTLLNYKPSLVTKIFDNNDDLISEYFIEKRILTPLDKIPAMLQFATIAVEDTAFYEHHGINFEGIVRAFFANIKAGRIVQGGSSITQQVAKQLFLTPERTLTRKIREAILSLRIDKKYSKNQILEIYLNHNYYGHGAYGVKAAAELYFGKPLNDLTIPEIAVIAGLPKAPNHYSPYKNLKRALKRRDHALNRLMAIKAIMPSQREKASAEKITLSGLKRPENKAPWFSEYVRRYLEKNYGAKKLYRGGLVVRTTLDLRIQKHAEMAVISGLENNDKRLGFRGPIGHVNLELGEQPDWEAHNPRNRSNQNPSDYYVKGARIRGLVTEVKNEKAWISFEDAKGVINVKRMAWAHPVNPSKDARRARKIVNATTVLNPGDIVEVKVLDPNPMDDGHIKLELDQTPVLQGALLAVDPKTGYVMAMVGGYDPESSKFNRSVQAKRQPGSSFKPIIYTAAFEKGFTLASTIIDSPIIYNKAITEFKGWKPENFEGKFFGPTTLRTAVTKSRNIVTIKLLKKIGIGYVAKYARRFGISSPLEVNLSLALGSSPVTMMEMATAFSTLANGGTRMNPIYIKTVKNREGIILENNEPSGKDVISPSVAYLAVHAMENVVREGTARMVGRKLKRPIAGKTGTTNSYIDAWFNGFTPNMVCSVWVGRDDNRPMGEKETGSRSAIPIWISFMEKALKGRPINDFIPPQEIIFTRIDKKTGKISHSVGDDTIFEAFLDGSQPNMFEATDRSDNNRSNNFRKGL